MKAITIKQPWASLIVEGIKDIENRTWATKFRGRVLVHAGAQMFNFNKLTDGFLYPQEVQDKFVEFADIAPDIPMGAIIGSVEIVDCVINHPSIWAEKCDIPNIPEVLENRHFFGKNWKPENIVYNLVLANPIKFPVPIPAKGRLSFWDYPNILAEPEEKGGELFCHCQLPIKEIDQVMPFFDGKHKCRYCVGQWYK